MKLLTKRDILGSLNPCFWIMVTHNWLKDKLSHDFFDVSVLHRSGWLPPCNHPASACWVLALQICATTHVVSLLVYKIHKMITNEKNVFFFFWWIRKIYLWTDKLPSARNYSDSVYIFLGFILCSVLRYDADQVWLFIFMAEQFKLNWKPT